MKHHQQRFLGLLISFLCIGLTNAFGQGFITTWKPSGTTITIRTNSISGSYNYDVTWTNLSNAGVGDGSTTGETGNYTITGLTASNTYQVEITGTFPHFYMNRENGRDDLLTIEQWGNNVWTSMESAFHGCKNLTLTATDTPNLTSVSNMSQMFSGGRALIGDISGWNVSNVTDMSYLFNSCREFNTDLSNWDVSKVTDMSYMFSGAARFDQNINSWNVSKVTDMAEMFNGAARFDQSISSWNVSKVTNMSNMFTFASGFDQDISGWNVSKVTDMSYMFYFASDFNQNISSWDVRKVLYMQNMFFFASGFNQDISGWNVSKVTNMSYMFQNASSFNQNLGSWNVGKVTNMRDMLNNTALSTSNYDSLLIGWASQTLRSNVTLGVTGTNYCGASAERQQLIDNFNWTINDAGQTCPDVTWNGSAWSPYTPISFNDVIINATYDVATNGDFIAKDITINAGKTLTITAGNISLTGNFDNNGGGITQTGGTITFNGTAAQTIEGDNSFHDLTINNASGVTLNSATSVTGVLTLTDGTLTTGGNLTLASTSAGSGGTATVDFSGSGSISGNVTQQRYLDADTQEGYRYIAPAVTGQTMADINDNITLIGLGTTYSPGSGAGYTWTSTSPAPNVFIYDQSLISGGNAGAGPLNGQSLNDAAYGWETPSATSDALNPGSAVTVNALSANTLVSFTGPLQSSDVVLSLAHGGQSNSGWHLVGNPFAATLDWNAIYDDGGNSGVEPTAYVFDATNSYAGTYAGYNAATDAGVNGGTQNIASGQAFFIQTSSGMTGDVTLKTAHTSNADVQFHRTQETDGGDLHWQGELRLKLADGQGHEDELLLYLIDDAQEGKDFGDAKKFFGNAWGLPEIASQAFDFELMMDCRPPLKNDEIKSFQLALKGGSTGMFTLKTTTIAQFEPSTEIFLEDRLTQQMIALQEGMGYDFEIDNAHEIISNRFWIHMRSNRVTSIPDDFTNHGVSLFAHNKQVNIQFTNVDAAKSQIAIYDLMGRIIYQQSNESKLNLSIPIEQNGIYIVKVGSQQGTISQKIIIE